MKRPIVAQADEGQESGFSSQNEAPVQTLDRLLGQSCRTYAAHPAFLCLGHSFCYAQIEQSALHFASWLQAQGLSSGTRVAVMLPNLPQYPVAIYGILRAGGVVVNCNPLYTPRELEFQLRDAEVEYLLVLENFAHTVADIRVPSLRHIIVTQVGDFMGFRGIILNQILHYWKKAIPPWTLPGAQPFNTILSQGAQLPFTCPSLTADHLAFLQYTGGTTGRAKGAMLSHGNIMANLTQVGEWVKDALVPGEERVVTALPLYHIFALTANCLLFWKLGATNLLIPNPRDIPALVKTLSRFPMTVFTGVNTLFAALLHHPRFSQIDFSHFKATLGGGMAVQPEIAEKWARVTGCPINQAYGLTETSPAVTLHPMTLEGFDGSIGHALPETEISLRTDEGHEVGEGESGEICVRGPQVMKGYWQQAEESTAVFWPDGFLKTGDIGRWGPGEMLFLLDRKKDMIKVSGFNVYPNEIEAVISQHPDVQEVAAIGVDDPHSGQAIKVFVVRRHPQLTTESLLTYCHHQLTGYKIPRQVEFRDSLPHSTIGKVLRRALKE
ncbi:MAG: AMP-binding protein [Ferrovum sp.]|nr:AMP-binding protein [Ferrovum sp.]